MTDPSGPAPQPTQPIPPAPIPPPSSAPPPGGTSASASAAAPTVQPAARDEAWRPPKDESADRGPGLELIWGLFLLAIGGWFFLDVTLGIDLPSISWSAIWPILIIAIGGFLLLRASGRRR